MSDGDDRVVEMDTGPLDQLMKLFKGGGPQVKVGILGSSAREGGGKSNAEIGAIHEFGERQSTGKGAIMRSFLRMPIAFKLEKELADAGAFVPKAFRDAIRKGELMQFLAKIGIVAEKCVLKAFDTGGYGQWVPSDMTHKKNHQTLIETQQLRNSITSKVE